MRVILEANGRSRRPFCVLLGDALLGYAHKPQLLSLSQFCNQRALAFRVVDDGRADPLVRAHGVDDEVARVNFHDLAGSGALGVEGELDAAVLAVLLTVAVARVEHLVGALGVEGDQAQTVGNKFVGQYAAVLFDLDQINRDGRDFGKDDTAEGVGEREVDVGKVKIDMVVVSLPSHKCVRIKDILMDICDKPSVVCYLCDLDLHVP